MCKSCGLIASVLLLFLCELKAEKQKFCKQKYINSKNQQTDSLFVSQIN